MKQFARKSEKPELAASPENDCYGHKSNVAPVAPGVREYQSSV
jgi:hypothetical protein